MKTFLTALATATVVGAGVWVFRDSTRQTPVAATAPMSAPVAQMPVPAKATSEDAGELEGRLEPGSETEIRTTLTGYPMRFRAEAGDFVQKGQLLVDLGDSKLEESVKQAEAALLVVKAKFQARETRLAQADKDPPSLISPAQSSPIQPAAGRLSQRPAAPLPTVPKRVETPEEVLDRSRLSQAEATVESAKLALAETRIVSPISGYVTQRLANGELSKPDTVLMRIVDIATVKTVVQVDPELYQKVVADQEARIAISEMPNRTFQGKVVRKAATLNLRTRVASVSIDVANPDAALKPGMYARVRLMFDQNHDPRLVVQSSWLGKFFKGARGADGKTANPQSDTEALNSLKGLTLTMSTMADELQRRETAAKATAEASRDHFNALETLIGRLREDATGTRRSSFEKTADEIDGLPALHVDDELLAFSTDVSKALREMAEQRRAIARETTAIDWTYWDRTQRVSSAIKSQGMQRINNGLADIRRKLTRRYNLEFLTTAERTTPSRGRRTRR
jgi:multidrug efflux pump subunit AcrA (membrane-fusion protein)